MKSYMLVTYKNENCTKMQLTSMKKKHFKFVFFHINYIFCSKKVYSCDRSCRRGTDGVFPGWFSWQSVTRQNNIKIKTWFYNFNINFFYFLNIVFKGQRLCQWPSGLLKNVIFSAVLLAFRSLIIKGMVFCKSKTAIRLMRYNYCISHNLLIITN